MEGVVNVPFGEPHWAIRRICLPNILQETGNPCPKLHGVGSIIFVGVCVDSRGNIIRCCRRITDQAGLSVCLIHGRKARDADEVANNLQLQIYWKNDDRACCACSNSSCQKKEVASVFMVDACELVAMLALIVLKGQAGTTEAGQNSSSYILSSGDAR